MICEKCNCKDDCGWYASYKKIVDEIYLGIGTDNTLGRALLATVNDNSLENCEYFEGEWLYESNDWFRKFRVSCTEYNGD